MQNKVRVDHNAKPELDVMRQETIVISAGQSEEDIENNFFRYAVFQVAGCVVIKLFYKLNLTEHET